MSSLVDGAQKSPGEWSVQTMMLIAGAICGWWEEKRHARGQAESNGSGLWKRKAKPPA